MLTICILKWLCIQIQQVRSLVWFPHIPTVDGCDMVFPPAFAFPELPMRLDMYIAQLGFLIYKFSFDLLYLVSMYFFTQKF